MKKNIYYTLTLFLASALLLLAFKKYEKGQPEQVKKYVQLKVGYVVGSGRAPAIIKVWEEKPDNTRGRELITERWIQRDESIRVETETGRIIYDYKYSSNDTWKTDFHAWCHRNEPTKVP